ncbi:MFS transporter [Reyranella sp.]|uniref:MFS transporter n=1 Tax=Reyranella sp. TaxID=1929291 RepID=UPI0027219B11|nr:MFS transporter [Reyranella sp.]MDO8973329.1 MFS transporter [Reyranella sp.]
MTVRPAFGLAIVGLGASLAPLDIAVNVALPAITAHFKVALGDAQWLVICYVLVYGSLMLVCGKLGDLFGHRLIFRIGLAISALGCAACAAAPDWPLFLWARGVQGVGTALALSCTPALATSLFPESDRTKALAGFASTMAIAAAIGPFLGGALVELWGWPAVYWVRVPLALVTLALSGLLPSPKPDSRPFDALGAVLLAACMSTLLLSLTFSQRKEIPGPWALAMALVALALIVAYVRRANRVPEPIIRPSLFADPRFTIPNVLNALANLAGFAILLLTPYYLVNVLKLTPLGVGIVLAMAYGGSLMGAPLSAFLVRRIGQRPTVFAGIAGVGLGLLPLGFTGIDTPVLVVAALLVLEGMGQGLLTVAYTDIVTTTLPARDRGVAGSLSLLTRTIGIVAGASVLTALQAYGAQGFMNMGGFLAGYRFAFVAAGGGLIAVLLLSLLWPRAWSKE